MPAIAHKELFEQANRLAFSNGYLVAYNDEVSIFDHLPDCESLAGAVDGRKLYELLNKSTAEAVTLSSDDGKLNVRAGRVKAAFDIVPVKLPLSEIDRTGEDLTLPDDFLSVLGLISGSCAREMSRPVLTCVRVQGDWLEAADGYRMARSHFEGADLPPILLPVTAAEIVVDYTVVTLGVGTGGEWARFSSSDGKTIVFTRLSSGNYPDLSALYDVSGVNVELPDLRDSLDRARIFAKRDHKIDEQINLELRPNQIEIKAICEGGQFAETVRWKGDITAAFSIHPDFLSGALSHSTTCTVGKDKIRFRGTNWEHVIALRT